MISSACLTLVLLLLSFSCRGQDIEPRRVQRRAEGIDLTEAATE